MRPRRHRKNKGFQWDATHLEPNGPSLRLSGTTATSSCVSIPSALASRASVWVPRDLVSLSIPLEDCDCGKFAPSKNALIAGRFSDANNSTRVIGISSCADVMTLLGLAEEPGKPMRRLRMTLRSLMDSPVSSAAIIKPALSAAPASSCASSILSLR